MSDDDQPTSIGLPSSEERGARSLVRRVGGKTARGIKRLVTDDRVREAAAGALVKLDAALSDRKNLERLQSLMATAGNFAMERSFDASPDARLLFEYADWCEATRSREEVSRSVFRDGLRLPFDLLGIIEKSMRGQVTRAELEEKRELMLDLLWYMASDAARPLDRLDDGLEREGIPDRFRVLFDRARGRTGGSEASGASRELTHRADVFRDPGIQFMLKSLPLFLQSYLLKLSIETLPDIASW